MISSTKFLVSSSLLLPVGGVFAAPKSTFGSAPPEAYKRTLGLAEEGVSVGSASLEELKKLVDERKWAVPIACEGQGEEAGNTAQKKCLWQEVHPVSLYKAWEEGVFELTSSRGSRDQPCHEGKISLWKEEQNSGKTHWKMCVNLLPMSTDPHDPLNNMLGLYQNLRNPALYESGVKGEVGGVGKQTVVPLYTDSREDKKAAKALQKSKDVNIFPGDRVKLTHGKFKGKFGVVRRWVEKAGKWGIRLLDDFYLDGSKIGKGRKIRTTSSFERVAPAETATEPSVMEEPTVVEDPVKNPPVVEETDEVTAASEDSSTEVSLSSEVPVSETAHVLETPVVDETVVEGEELPIDPTRTTTNTTTRSSSSSKSISSKCFLIIAVVAIIFFILLVGLVICVLQRILARKRGVALRVDNLSDGSDSSSSSSWESKSSDSSCGSSSDSSSSFGSSVSSDSNGN